MKSNTIDYLQTKQTVNPEWNYIKNAHTKISNNTSV